MSEHKIILASGSPRRRELMDRICGEYTIIPSSKAEDMSEPVPSKLVTGLAAMKANDVFEITCERINNQTLGHEYKDRVIIGCDTIVSFDDKRLGKPHSTQEAFDMIASFRNRTHQVLTGVSLLLIDDNRITQKDSFFVSTDVEVTDLTDDEIRRYIETGEPMDKAGAYAIQGLFCPYVKAIRGDYYNIVGFPVSSVYYHLKDLGITLRK